MILKSINPDELATPGGHYSPGYLVDNLLFVSGQLPITAEGEKITGDLEDQMNQVLKNVQTIVISAGGEIDQIVKTTIYISDVALWPKVNKIYADFFKDHKPARAVVPVPGLHYGFLVEMEAIARIN